GVNGHRTGLADMHPGADLLRLPLSAAALGQGRRFVPEERDQQPTADGTQKLAAAPVRRRGRVAGQLVPFHLQLRNVLLAVGPPPFMTLPACSMAATIRA